VVSEAGIIHDSQRNWFSMESEHFVVHYHDDEVHLAKKALNIAESVHRKLVPLFDWSPLTKTTMILSDETDISNGFATPFPSNRITLYVSQPHLVNSLEDHDGWLEALILHEYVHILHMDQVRGGLAVARGIFGRFPLLFPHVFMPPWMHEGLATYLETDQTLGIGRGQSSYFAMMMRVEVQAGVKPLSQINQPMVSWPLLTSRYLYGVYFQQFLSDTYGKDTWQRLVYSYSDHAMPYRINGVYEDVLGKDLSALWEEFTRYLQARFQGDIAELAGKSLHQGKALTQTGDFKRSVLQAEDGRIFFVSDHLLRGAKLMVKEGSSGQAKVLADVHAGARLDWHESAGLLLTQPDLCRNANTYYDLYRIDPDSGASTRLTHCQRYIYAVWSPDASEIIAVLNQGGQHALHRLNQQGQLQDVLWQGKAGETLSQIDWSADGQAVVAAMWREHSGWNVEEFAMASGQWRMLTDDAAIETDARYIGGTREVIFSADSDGVYNIHRFTEQGERQQISRVLGGAFSPWFDGHGDLLYVGYGEQGFDIWQDDAPLSLPLVVERQAKQFGQKNVGALLDISEPRAYSPWASLLPTYWIPQWGWTDQGSEYGVSTSGSDALKRHQYSAYLGYHSVTQAPTLQLNYVYDGWRPLLQFSGSQTYRSSVDQQGALVALSKEQAWDVGLVFPDLSMDESTAWQVGVSYQQSSLAWLHPEYVVTGKVGARDVLAGLAWSQDTRSLNPRATSYADGSLRSMMLETGKVLGGDYTGTSVASTWQQHLSTADGSMLGMVRGQLAWQSDDARAYQLGGLSQGALPAVNNMLQAGLPFNQRNFPLRGYSNNAPQLAGHQLALLTAELRFPLARVERGWMVPPIGLDQVFGQFFVDAGAVNNAQVYVGTGAELGMDMVLFYGVKIRLFLGYAQGSDPNIGGEFTYLRLSSGF
ncbi:MAG: hypothetical protein R8M45_08405, partial [Ghiorsea sp.]